MIHEIVFPSYFTGSNLVNGVQMNYSLPVKAYGNGDKNGESVGLEGTAKSVTTTTNRLTLRSPLLSSSHDSPTGKSLIIAENDYVHKVSIRYGSLVDSVKVTTKLGMTCSWGGEGGGEMNEVVIPVGWKFCGFYGGTGGHLHNLGVVVMKDESNVDDEVDEVGLMKVMGSNGDRIGEVLSKDFLDFTSQLINRELKYRDLLAVLPYKLLRLYELGDRQGIWSAKMLSYHPHRVDQRRQAAVGTLIAQIWKIYKSNDPVNAKTCLETIALYNENLSANRVDHQKLRKVRGSNKFFYSSVMSVIGGLSLFCFGPAGYHLQMGEETITSDSGVTVKKIKKIGDGVTHHQDESKEGGIGSDAVVEDIGKALADIDEYFQCTVRLYPEGGNLSREEWNAALIVYGKFLRECVTILFK